VTTSGRTDLDRIHTTVYDAYGMKQDPIRREQEALRYIRNALVHGRSPTVREIQGALGYRSPRSAAEILGRLIERGLLARRPDKSLQLRRFPEENASHARTIDVPLVGTAPCGEPMLAEENIETTIPVSVALARPPHRYFLLRASGDSMNRAGIETGDLVLVRQQPQAESGERVVALIDGEATIKEYHPAGEVVMLRPHSTNKAHKPILLSSEFQIQGVVVATIRDWMKGHSNE
jgi:repressor LexA